MPKGGTSAPAVAGDSFPACARQEQLGTDGGSARERFLGVRAVGWESEENGEKPVIISRVDIPMTDFTEIDDLKAGLDAHRPIDPKSVQAVQEKFRLEWTYHSNALEGNPLTLSETSFFIREGLTSKGRPLSAYLEVKIQSGSMVLHFKIGGERPTLRSQTLPNEKRRFTQGQGIALQGIAVISPLQPELFLHCLDGFGFNRAVNIKPSLQSFYLCEIRHGNIHPANYNWLFTIFLAFPPHRAHAEEPFPSAPA